MTDISDNARRILAQSSDANATRFNMAQMEELISNIYVQLNQELNYLKLKKNRMATCYYY